MALQLSELDRKGAHIVVADEEAIIAQDLLIRLINLGYDNTKLISRPPVLLEYLSKVSVDILVLDMWFGNIYNDLLFEKQVYSIAPNCLIIYLSVFDGEETYSLFSKSDAFGFLHKPLDERELKYIIDLAARHKALERKSDYYKEKYEIQKSESTWDSAITNALLRANPDLLFVQSKEGVYLDIHVANEALLLAPIYDQIGKKNSDILPEDVTAKINKKISLALETNELQTVEYTLQLKDSLRWFEARITALNTDSVLTIVRDITERKRAEISLILSENKYKNLTELLPQTVFEIDTKFDLILCNKKGLETFGYTEEDIDKGLNVLDLIIESDYPMIHEKIKLLIASPQNNAGKYTGIKKDGTHFPIVIYSSVIKEGGKVAGFRGIIVDASEADATENALRKSEEKYRNLIETMNDVVFAFDINRIVTYISPAIEKILDYNASEMLGHDAFSYIHVEDRELLMYKLQLLASGETSYDEFRFVRKNGSNHWVGVSSTPVFNDNVFDGVQGVIYDIQGRKHAEEVLAENRQFYEAVYNFANLLIFIQDCYDGRFINVNKTACNVLGYSESELIGKNLSDISQGVSPYSHFEATGYIKAATALGSESFEWRIKNKNSSLMWVEAAMKVIDVNGDKRIVTVMNNINDRKLNEREAEISRSRLEALIKLYTLNESDVDKILSYTIREASAVTLSSIGFVGMLVDNSPVFKHLAITGDIAKSAKFISDSTRADFTFSDYRELFGPKPEPIIMNMPTILEKHQTNGPKLKFLFERFILVPVFENDELVLVAGLANKETEYNDTDARQLVLFLSGMLQVIRLRENQEENRKLYSAVEQSPLSVIITDVSGTIEYVNPKFCEVSGYSAEEAKGNNPKMLKSGEQSEQVYRDLWNTIKSGNEWSGELHNKRKDGTLFWESISISPIKNHEGAITHFIAIKENIDSKKKMSDELETALRHSEVAINFKNSLLNNINHELRTPLNGIMGFAQVLEDELDGGELSEYARRITFSGNRLMDTLDNIINLGDLESDKMVFNKAKTSVSAVLRKIEEPSKHSAHQKKLEFSIVEKCTNLYIDSDERYIIQVLNNVIHNAIKYSAKGGVSIVVDKTYTEERAFVLISVTDTGIGIETCHLETIFEDFKQVSEGVGRNYEGTGLGLSLARRIARKLGGEIKVRSQFGIGSTFDIIIPLTSDIENTIMPPVEGIAPVIVNSTDGVAMENKTANILVVEDNSINRDLIKYYIGKNYNYIMAASGEEALKHCSDTYFDIVLMDINLGIGLDGIRTTQMIKEIPGFENTQFVAMTGFASGLEREKLLHAGLQHFIAKPFTKRDFLEILERISGSV